MKRQRLKRSNKTQEIISSVFLIIRQETRSVEGSFNIHMCSEKVVSAISAGFKCEKLEKYDCREFKFNNISINKQLRSITNSENKDIRIPMNES